MDKRTSEEIRAEIRKLESELKEAEKREEMEENGVIVLPEYGVFTVHVHGMKLKAYVSDITVFHDSLGPDHAKIELTCDADR